MERQRKSWNLFDAMADFFVGRAHHGKLSAHGGRSKTTKVQRRAIKASRRANRGRR